MQLHQDQEAMQVSLLQCIGLRKQAESQACMLPTECWTRPITSDPMDGHAADSLSGLAVQVQQQAVQVRSPFEPYHPFGSTC